jgi:hypothetical protein
MEVHIPWTSAPDGEMTYPVHTHIRKAMDFAKSFVTDFVTHEESRVIGASDDEHGRSAVKRHMPDWYLHDRERRRAFREHNRLPGDPHDESVRADAARQGFCLPSIYKDEYVYVRAIRGRGDKLQVETMTQTWEVNFVLQRNDDDPTNITFVDYQDRPRSGF